jgi:hypothetical protein
MFQALESKIIIIKSFLNLFFVLNQLCTLKILLSKFSIFTRVMCKFTLPLGHSLTL